MHNNCTRVLVPTSKKEFRQTTLKKMLSLLKLGFVLREISCVAAGCEPLDAELASHYRSPHVRCIVRTRVMCQAGRARAAGAGRRGDIVAWLCKRAPLWVVVHVCALLRDAYTDDVSSKSGDD